MVGIEIMPMAIVAKARVITTTMEFILFTIEGMVMSNMSNLMDIKITTTSEY